MSEDFVIKKIMIVEDNPVNQKVMQKLVKIFGHESLVIDNGFEAVEIAKSYQPDLILMDIQLIGISGIEVTQNIKKDEKLKSIPIVAVTASATTEDREKIVRESKCDDYLAKPFSPKELAATISQYFAVKKVDL